MIMMYTIPIDTMLSKEFKQMKLTDYKRRINQDNKNFTLYDYETNEVIIMDPNLKDRNSYEKKYKQINADISETLFNPECFMKLFNSRQDTGVIIEELISMGYKNVEDVIMAGTLNQVQQLGKEWERADWLHFKQINHLDNLLYRTGEPLHHKEFLQWKKEREDYSKPLWLYHKLMRVLRLEYRIFDIRTIISHTRGSGFP